MDQEMWLLQYSFMVRNYDGWAQAIRTALKPKWKFGFIDGTVEKPTNDEKFEDWIAVHSILVEIDQHSWFFYMLHSR